jgi:hypothetical protein
MGTIETIYDLDNNLAIHVVKGNVNTLAIITKVKAFIADRPTKYEIWDFTEGAIHSLYAEDIRSMAQVLKEPSEVGKVEKSALVFSDNLSYGIGRMTEVYFSMEKITVEIECFRGLKEAKMWISIEDKL